MPTSTPAVRASGRRFRILGTIGSGGFGTVYKAEMLGEGGFSKIYALKVLNPDVEVVAEVAQRLRDEARILGLVRHRAIVQADSLLHLGGRWAVAMEYVEGVDLKDVIAHGPVPTGPALEIVEEVAQALHQAHTQPGPDGQPLCLLHRDIKPPNVQITTAGEVKVLDFGTARANFSKREAKTRELAFGTLDYMSPERMEFEDTHAGDVYAVGAVMVELLSGKPLGRTAPIPRRHEKVLQHAKDLLEGQPADVAALALRCLAWSATDRPTAAELARSCRQLRGQGQTEFLADWAAHHVPGWMAARGGLRTDGMTGTVLTESSSIDTHGAAPSRATPAAAPPRATPAAAPPRATPAAAAPRSPPSPGSGAATRWVEPEGAEPLVSGAAPDAPVPPAPAAAPPVAPAPASEVATAPPASTPAPPPAASPAPSSTVATVLRLEPEEPPAAPAPIPSPPETPPIPARTSPMVGLVVVGGVMVALALGAAAAVLLVTLVLRVLGHV
jgi:hypothetical protein